MRIYVHEPEKRLPGPVEVDEQTTIAVLVAEQTEQDGDAVVMVEETEIVLVEELTLVEAGVGDRGHVHVGRRKTVHVSVEFNAKVLEKDFAPAQTVHRAHDWAVGDKAFDLPRGERAKHMLALAGTNDRPAADVHLGSLADHEGCVRFDLVPKKRFEG
jgi:sulfur carrier protein ThiS